MNRGKKLILLFLFIFIFFLLFLDCFCVSVIAGAVVDEAAGDCWGEGLSLWLFSPTVAASVASLSAARRFVLCTVIILATRWRHFPSQLLRSFFL